jgi:hypothetical protein
VGLVGLGRVWAYLLVDGLKVLLSDALGHIPWRFLKEAAEQVHQRLVLVYYHYLLKYVYHLFKVLLSNLESAALEELDVLVGYFVVKFCE